MRPLSVKFSRRRARRRGPSPEMPTACVMNDSSQPMDEPASAEQPLPTTAPMEAENTAEEEEEEQAEEEAAPAPPTPPPAPHLSPAPRPDGSAANGGDAQPGIKTFFHAAPRPKKAKDDSGGGSSGGGASESTAAATSDLMSSAERVAARSVALAVHRPVQTAARSRSKFRRGSPPSSPFGAVGRST